MKEFVYKNPTKIIFGKNTIKQITKEIINDGYKKILFVAGKESIKKYGIYDQLDFEGLEVTECWGVQANPTLEKAEEILKVAKEKKVDAILAVGGGSVIDTAKAVAAAYYVDNMWSLFEKMQPITKALPLYTVLTISATGTEMNGNSVITNETERKKWAIMGSALYPKVSVIDPSVQVSLPWNQTTNGAIDALSHIMEYYFMGDGDEITLSVNEALMKDIIKNTDMLQKNEKDEDARANLAWAATMALNGMSGIMLKGGDWACHQIEHGISAFKTDVAHGTGLAIVFPSWIKEVQKENEKTFLRWAKNVWGKDSVEDGIKAMKEKYSSWGVPISLKEIDVAETSIEEIAEIIVEKGLPGKVKQLQKEDVVSILERAA